MTGLAWLLLGSVIVMAILLIVVLRHTLRSSNTVLGIVSHSVQASETLHERREAATAAMLDEALRTALQSQALPQPPRQIEP